MKTGRYSLKDLLTHNEIDQLVIPELQRDYVWEEEQVNRVWESLMKRWNKKTKADLSVNVNGNNLTNNTILQHLQQVYTTLQFKQKMGFIYAYHDKQLPGQFFLIDGQQRITTFYLLLLVLYTKAEKKDAFSKLYYDNKFPKVDYKVRESAYEFMRLFIEDTLKGKDYKQNKDFFEIEYTNDITVQNLRNNFDFLEKQLVAFSNDQLVDLIDFVENYVEFNYFDTQLSAQGERLYLYMNSRGYHLSHQEKLRANLIEKCSKEDKKEAGALWEEWQDFFFEYKFSNENADQGFELFLYYASVLKQYLEGNFDREIEFQTEKLKTYEIDNLDIIFLSKAFSALKKVLIEIENPSRFIEDFFTKSLKTLNLRIRVLPLWFWYLNGNLNAQTINDKELYLFRNFLINYSHTREVADEPTVRLDQILEGISKSEKYDVVGILNDLQIPRKEHEINKINYIKDSPVESINHPIEKVYFDEKLNKFLEGRTDILFKLIYFNLDSDFPKDKANNVINILGILFHDLRSKMLRKYILSYFDYSTHTGNSAGKEKWALMPDSRAWLNTVVNNDGFLDIIKDWETKQYTSVKDAYKDRLALFNDEQDWRYYFIKFISVLEHTQSNQFIWSDNSFNIKLLNNINPSQWDVYLVTKIFIEISKTESISFNNFGDSIAYTDLVLENNEVVTKFVDTDRLCIDIVYEKQGKWAIDIFYKKDEMLNLRNFAVANSYNEWKEGYFIKYRNSNCYNYEMNKSLKENLEQLNKLIMDLIFNLKNENLIPEYKS
ncbi:DUF262 domain-containing protein [Empedobacter sp.]|uniref:DUF262 domain-containing protein n=1 Tax=Empedobacter sp. TaxID=1927715 RepID=UPI0028B020AB|nr:DUF262 domain-containing protein [Empedobacter sp.]